MIVFQPCKPNRTREYCYIFKNLFYFVFHTLCIKLENGKLFEVVPGNLAQVWLIYLSLFNLLHVPCPDILFLTRPEVFKCARLLCLGKNVELLPL